MDAVLLAAGKGARLRPETHATPKPLLRVGGKAVLDYVLACLPDEVTRIFLVVNHLREQIIDHVGPSFADKPITYAIQEPLTGTAGALHLLKDVLRDRFLVLNADNIYAPTSIKQLCTHTRALLIKEVDHALTAGVQSVEDHFVGLSTCRQPPCSIVCGAYVLDRTFFDLELIEIQVGSHMEFGLPQTLSHSTHPIRLVKTDFWFPIGTHEELKHAQTHFQSTPSSSPPTSQTVF